MKHSELIEMIRRVVREKKRTVEAKVVPTAIGRILPSSDIDDIDTLTRYFGEGNSGFEIDEPMFDIYCLKNYDENDIFDKDFLAIKKLLKKYPNGAKFVGNIFNNALSFPPSAPSIAFEALIEIDPKKGCIRVSAPYNDNNGHYFVGWFDSLGKYHSDTENFNLDGDYIGKDNNTNEAKVVPTGLNIDPIEMWKKKEMIRCLKILQEKTSKEAKKLNLKIGKYNVSGNELGVEMTWNEGQPFLSTVTKRNAETLFNKLNITPENVYVGVVPTRCAYSYYITGTYNNNPIAIARKETDSSMAGQTYLITPNLKKQFSKFDTTYTTNDLEEAKVVPTAMGRILPKTDADLIDNYIVDEDFGSGYSGFDLYDTISETYSLETYCEDDYGDDEKCKAIKTLLAKYPNGGTFVSNNILNNFDKAPGAPSNSFTSMIYINLKDKDISVHVPWVDETYNKYNVGWFDGGGKYYPDIKNFNEDGDYIENV